MNVNDLFEGKDPCWKGYRQLGTKKKGGKTVPNCVPNEGVAEADFNPARRGFLKKAGAVAASAAMPTGLAGAAAKAMAPAASIISAPFVGLSAVDLDDIINLLDSSDSKNMIPGEDPYELDTIKSVAMDAGRNSWGNSWFTNGDTAKALLDAIELGKKNGMSDTAIIDNLKSTATDLYADEMELLKPEHQRKVQSQSLRTPDISEPKASTSKSTGMSSLARAAGAQIGRTMKNVGRGTADTILNQPARDMGRIEPTKATAALPAPSVKTGMTIPRQKSRVSVSPFDDDHSEIDQFVKEEWSSRGNPAAAWPDFGHEQDMSEGTGHEWTHYPLDDKTTTGWAKPPRGAPGGLPPSDWQDRIRWDRKDVQNWDKPKDVSESDQPVTAHGYAYNRQDQRVAWTREFASEAAAKEWARRRNATVLSIVPKQDELNPGMSEARANTNSTRAGLAKREKSPDPVRDAAKQKEDQAMWDMLQKHIAKQKKEPGVTEAERNEMDTPAVQSALKNMADRHKNEKWTKEQLAALGRRLAAQDKKPVKESISDDDIMRQYLKEMRESGYDIL